jgi:hypothetical protein
MVQLTVVSYTKGLRAGKQGRCYVDDAVAGGDEVAGRSLFQQSRRPTSRIAQVLTSDCNAAYNKIFDEQQLLLQVIARGLEGVGRTVLHRHLSESNIEL